MRSFLEDACQTRSFTLTFVYTICTGNVHYSFRGERVATPSRTTVPRAYRQATRPFAGGATCDNGRVRW
jgi:hypothetical protein